MILLDGKKIADEILEKIKKEIETLKKTTYGIPGLAVIIVGSNPASQAYVSKKHKIALRLGINSRVSELDEKTSQEILVNRIKSFNQDNHVHAVLIQLPLPDGFKTWEILNHLDPEKDVDRFLPINLGNLLLNRTEIYPCTPAGVLALLDAYQIELRGLNAVMVGRSFIVGKPLASMLTNRNATVTLCHSQTKDLAGLLRQADLIVAAIGKAGFITPDMVKKDAILIDVGQNFLTQAGEVIRLCTPSQQKRFEKKGVAITGDIHIDAFKKSSYYTPVPGGIGPMTVAMLMHNTLQLFKRKTRQETS
jgi:methylenetetrahydrofolate dehydrogenase (NADP+)/methenyltetrahydrofolate cyclohydrolase